MQATQLKLDTRLNDAPCAYLSLGEDGLVQAANRGFLDLVGLSADDVVGCPVQRLLMTPSQVFWATTVLPLLKAEGRVSEMYIALKGVDSQERPTLMNAAVIHEPRGAVRYDLVLMHIQQRHAFESELLRARQLAQMATQVKDRANAALEQARTELVAKQSELIALNSRLEALASTDSLTGLRNHRAFLEAISDQVDHAAASGLSLSLCLADVDFFKRVNDTYGHPVGDRCLQAIAKILTANCRASDFVARYGGEEFAIMLPLAGATASRIAAEHLRCAVEAADWVEPPVTISIGISTWRPGLSLAEFIAEADRALYASKEEGRNRVTHIGQIIEML